MAFIEEIEEAWEEEHLCETDKAWDGIHRCLTDGELLYENGESPLNHCICGGQQLYRGDEYTLSYVTAAQVVDVAAALGKVTQARLRQGYRRINPDDYEFEMGEEDFAYLWENLQDLKRFYRHAARAGRAVVFTCDS